MANDDDNISGLIDGYPADAYHARDAVSASRLKAMRRSAAHCRWELDHPRRTPALDFGCAFHSYCEDPTGFLSRYAVEPDVDGRTKAGKATREAFALSLHGRTAIGSDDFARIAGMTAAVMAHPEARQLVRAPGRVEVSGFWRDAEHGLPCKLRADKLVGRTVVDLKTTEDASPAAFPRSVAKYGYHIQAAWYLAGLGALKADVDEFVIVAVEKAPPYGVAVYRVDDVALVQGYDEARVLLGNYAECVRTGVWPCYSDNIEPITLPAWALAPGDELNLTLDGEAVGI